ncbi:MAG: hypothetical protein HRT77_04665 [Halioglobus sp.]|nr:hypothetical protein [Halioglobus sp.]
MTKKSVVDGAVEMKRLIYLQALGIDRYVSRQALPGAAFTRRLAVGSRPCAAVAALDGLSDRRVKVAHTLGEERAGVAAVPKLPPGEAIDVPRFSLSAIVAGQWLWLEDLGGLPLTAEQLRLVEAMARALYRANTEQGDSSAEMGKPVVGHFDWPMHNNRQLALGEDAARAAVLGFVSRRLQQLNCVGLVVLGEACVERVSVDEIDTRSVCIPGSLDILAKPSRKPQVWRDLLRILDVK